MDRDRHRLWGESSTGTTRPESTNGRRGSIFLIWRSTRRSPSTPARKARAGHFNVTNNIYSIAKESELTPIQYAPRRSVVAELLVRF
jgi:hypothetical protein